MRKLIRRTLAAILVLCLTSFSALAATTVQPVREYNGEFTDVPSGAWYESNVITAYEYGLVEGTGGSNFSPLSKIDVASAVTLAARIYSSYVGDNADFSGGSPWYQPYYDYCVKNGIINTDDFPLSNMAKAATRYQIAAIFANTLPESEYAAINTVSYGAIPDVPADSAYMMDVYKLYKAGIMTGDSSSKFNGTSYISRSEIAAVITRLLGVEPRTSVTLTVDVPEDKFVTIGGKEIYLGMWEAELIDLMGQPDETMSTTYYGYPVYVYGTSDYVNFCYIGVSDGEVAYICASGRGFDYMGYKMGDTTEYDSSKSYGKSYGAALYRDSNDNDIIHTVVLRDASVSLARNTSEAALDNEAKLNFYLTNAFRVYHNATKLKWSEPMADLAKSYSTKMSDEGFFAHTTPDGITARDRIESTFYSHIYGNLGPSGENIAWGYRTAVDVTNGWINSSGHRTNMLYSSYSYLGVGRYGDYWTQDFFGFRSW
jgi:uncharacterized protein YkwD